ncbi:MAG: superoxide dismutase [bacterium]
MSEKNLRFYSLPKLPYDFNGLEPYISADQLKTHYYKHHQKYVNASNEILAHLDNARKENLEIDAFLAKKLNFNAAGAILHSLFWFNLSPPSEEGGGKPTKSLDGAIKREFGSFERFKEEFIKAALEVEGPGWPALAYDKVTNRILISPIEKHNFFVYPSLKLLLVLDLWEHAYYIDYKSDKSKYINSFWKIINWNTVKRRLELAMVETE